MSWKRKGIFGGGIAENQRKQQKHGPKTKARRVFFLYEDKTISVSSLNGALDTIVSIYPVTLPTQATTDNVEKPSHYFGIYGLEVEKVLRNFIPRYENGYTAHRVGSAVEYLLRAPLKNGVEDIKKAHRNLGMLLEELGEDETI